MKYIFIQLLTLNILFHNVLTPSSSFIVSDKNPNKELTEKRWISLQNKINSSENQIQWLTKTISDQNKLITELKKSKKNTDQDKAIAEIENEINLIVNKKSNEPQDKKLELVTKQVQLQSDLLVLLGYKSPQSSETWDCNLANQLNFPAQLNRLKTIIEKQTPKIEALKQISNAPTCQVTTLETGIKKLQEEALEPSKQNIYSQIHLFDEMVKRQAQLLTLLNIHK